MRAGLSIMGKIDMESGRSDSYTQGLEGVCGGEQEVMIASILLR